MKERIAIVCPGRGTYNQNELGYLKRNHGDRFALLSEFDAYRAQQGQATLSDLDGRDKYSLKEHSSGDNASALIYACAYADFLSIDRDRYDIVAVTGNSMGWYIALACAGALAPMDALHLINHMGVAMHNALIGGQLVYTLLDPQWNPLPGRREQVLALLNDINDELGTEEAFVSIELGGMLVLAGSDRACKMMMTQLPPEQERFPMKLHNHAAFHTPLQNPVMQQARRELTSAPFRAPQTPLVDGRGVIWTPWSTDTQALWDYTLGHQVVETYDFTKAVEVTLKEFAPDRVVVLGPGDTLGGSVAQTMARTHWRGVEDKHSFSARQSADPVLLAMGREEQATPLRKK
ncbi:ACP S-malonyltransferase [Hahella aquimaris]|uniref:ACP S-malonyltransferase n=1 Tax=Hahella sp. HNIBRBA332 TaxID=3015983 RepID=UPI00273BAFE1|nr:ACP S-malonyltransferase [Hahella sp. HNIBRBA332]WLQ13878.1 ACP S-malonyltransferase [Hahella sp. HNIBRBA332]